MNRQCAIALMGAALLASFCVHAQEGGPPLIGFLGARSAHSDARLLAAFSRGLEEAGYRDRHNARIEYRWADGHYGKLPALAAELVRLKPAVIVAVGGNVSALAAKSATSSIPVVFAMGGDPVELGVVANMGRPGGNVTGITMFSADLDGKRLELLRDVAPAAKVLAVIINPGNPIADSELRQARRAADAFGQTLHVFTARSDEEIDEAFRAIGRLRADALGVSSDGYFIGRRAKLVALAGKLRVPAVYAVREFAEAGGLMSYGTNFAEMYRLVGSYAGRVLKGAAPASLPVQRPTRYELVVNLRTAKDLGIEIPRSILLRADTVIE